MLAPVSLARALSIAALAAMAPSCVATHSPTVEPGGRPATACVTQGGLIHYAIAQTSESGDACVVLTFSLGGSARGFSADLERVRLDGPDGYSFESLLRYVGACEIERVREPETRITSADEIDGFVEVVPTTDTTGHATLSAVLSATFPASSDGTIAASNVDLDARLVMTQTRDLCPRYAD